MGPQESQFGHACAEPLGESGQGRAGQGRSKGEASTWPCEGSMAEGHDYHLLNNRNIET